MANMSIKSRGTKVGDLCIAAACVLIICVCLLPIINILAQSLSSPEAIISRKVGFLPVETNFESYSYVFKDPTFSRSLAWTAILTVICTLVSLAVTILCAYPLTYDEKLKGNRAFSAIILFTMYFGAGTIPTYIWMKQLGLLENPLVLIIPNCLSVFNMIILRSFFYSVPIALRESAELDGANPFTVLINVYLPLSAPVLATLALFYAVGRWNGFSDALLYLTDPTYHPIQLKLYNLINNLSSIEIAAQEGIAGGAPQASEGMKAAAVMIATVPIVIVYPWLQRYFIAGVSVGAVKG
jgi:putative aldouronate transport system permease protein